MSRSECIEPTNLVTRNNHVKYQSSGTRFSNVILKQGKVFKMLARLPVQGHKVKKC